MKLRRWAPLLAVLIISAAAQPWLQRPDSRTAFVVDTSVSNISADFVGVADAVSAAARNAGEEEYLSLRGFSGPCDGANTSLMVNGDSPEFLAEQLRNLAPGGAATLESGLLAAIDDFDSWFPLPGSERNRIVLVTTRGVDRCRTDQSAVHRAVADKARDSGVSLDFRIIGYHVPTDEQQALTDLAAALGAPAPRFTGTPTELADALR
ncbi:hypothetical protein CLV40_101359 [Actinokineospora auranticolor]|uniref:von Willebrand factor type A domain-containing protein n=1 Tax=Actinokineospora auranticolor TaxID=155976 RepID=A0A2S6H170_9PSEU|nr:VWA domain-containing protein [Actinokineospora auranticolor]PPK71170.1 hypothetical protein CLV40_101359 [Actinokineospora auranticolor]